MSEEMQIVERRQPIIVEAPVVNVEPEFEVVAKFEINTFRRDVLLAAIVLAILVHAVMT